MKYLEEAASMIRTEERLFTAPARRGRRFGSVDSLPLVPMSRLGIQSATVIPICQASRAPVIQAKCATIRGESRGDVFFERNLELNCAAVYAAVFLTRTSARWPVAASTLMSTSVETPCVLPLAMAVMRVRDVPARFAMSACVSRPD